MKTRKIFLLALMMFGLTSCSLFDDSDIAIHNTYNPPEETHTPGENGEPVAGGVEGTDAVIKDDDGNVVKDLHATVFKSVCYATDDKIANTYKAGGVNENEFDVNGGEDYAGGKSRNNYDLYIPKAFQEDTTKMDQNHVVVLFIHGGAWVSGFKTDVNEYLYEFTDRGYIAATIKYSLLRKEMDDPTLSIFRDLDEIDACIKSIKTVLTDLGFNTAKTKLVLGGASSGAHLAMLYSYSRGQHAALPIQFIVDAVGPVNIIPDAWKCFTSSAPASVHNDISASANSSNNAYLDTLPVAGMGYNWDEYHTMFIANGMCGLPYPISTVEAASSNKVDITEPSNPAAQAMCGTNGGEAQLSVTYWINKGINNYPIVCAYAGQDSVVGINQYATLQTALDNQSIDYSYFYFKNSNHQDIDNKQEDRVEVYNNFLAEITSRCNALL